MCGCMRMCSVQLWLSASRRFRVLFDIEVTAEFQILHCVDLQCVSIGLVWVWFDLDFVLGCSGIGGGCVEPFATMRHVDCTAQLFDCSAVHLSILIRV